MAVSDSRIMSDFKFNTSDQQHNLIHIKVTLKLCLTSQCQNAKEKVRNTGYFKYSWDILLEKHEKNLVSLS